MKTAATLFLLLLAGATFGQTPHHRALASHVIVPHARPFGAGANTQIREVTATIDIVEQVATTTLDISVTNATARRVEAEMIVPVPIGAALRGFQFQGNAPEGRAQLLAKEEARHIYDS